MTKKITAAVAMATVIFMAGCSSHQTVAKPVKQSPFAGEWKGQYECRKVMIMTDVTINADNTAQMRFYDTPTSSQKWGKFDGTIIGRVNYDSKKVVFTPQSKSIDFWTVEPKQKFGSIEWAANLNGYNKLSGRVREVGCKSIELTRVK